MKKSFVFKKHLCGVDAVEGGSSLPVKDLKRLGLVIGFFVAVILVRSYVFQIVPVVGDSMNPTLKNGDILISKPNCEDVSRYDIVIAKAADQVVIKRVIGTPGETVWIQNGSVFVDGVRVDENYDFLTEDPGVACAPFVLGEDEYFLLGDNRSVSYDSRGFGPVKKEQLLGVILLRVFPFQKIK